ncbi:AMP-binding protein [Auritidibacter ignavus]|uniref:class I adenylate-forming enzyme family protein n=1 Tax=Auritidibacter ignavus TaxID=678932 RepID=UPI002446AD8B|nr:AMP-binding protein [Auritidibacter ignavus]WGH81133.1 AMP-binding protein [Auritidibacter ignavus]WHS35829.1 AMP-binding protein [Auritidibacter ignavus]
MSTYFPWLAPSERADQTCLTDANHSLSYRELSESSRAFASQLADHGIGHGDVVAIMLPNRIELVVAIFAAWRLGAAATPINPVFTDREATHQLTDSGAKVIVTAEPDRFAERLATIDVNDVLAEDKTTENPAADHEPEPESAAQDIALLIYTSGSTGRPKGVMLDHANLHAMTEQMMGAFNFTGDEHCLLVLPLFHSNALLVSILTPLRAGTRTTILERFHPVDFLEAIATYRPTYFSCVPTILAHLTALPAEAMPDTSSLRFAVCGAAPASAELLQRAEEMFDIAIVEGYGLTEGTCASASNPIEGVRKPGTVGIALPGQQIRIVDPEGNEVPTGETGEIIISGPTVMRGYLGKPEATAKTVVDGWLHTGDVGKLDEDGYLTIVDRIKDMIIRGGENIYPKEIESVLYGVEGVLEAAVISKPDPSLGEVPVARVSLYSGSTLTPEDLLAECRKHLTKIKVPVELTIIDEIPKNPVGKIDKPRLRQELSTAS